MPDSSIGHNHPRDMLGRQALVSVTEAQNRLLNHLQDIKVAVEQISIERSLDRITAEDILSLEDLPAYPRSTMDGYAVIASDTFGASESMPCYLNIIGEVLMGENPTLQVTPGNCVRIATGGLMPPGADAVVMFEHTIPVDNKLLEIIKSVGSGSNIIDKGDDIGMHKTALPAGHLLRPQDLGLLAGIGITEVCVRRRVKMGLLSTGDELIPYNMKPKPGQIRNINSVALANAARRLGVEVTDYGIVEDNKDSFFPAIIHAMSENDLVIFSGGSSVGTRDLGEEAVSTLGSPGVLVHGVALKPGKPVLIGMHDKKPIFGLPGHPVSAMVCFEFFVIPAIRKISGLKKDEHPQQASVTAFLGRNIPSAPGRCDVVRVQLEKVDGRLTAFPVLGKSGSISTLSRAHGYIIIEDALQGLTEESQVEVYLFQ